MSDINKEEVVKFEPERKQKKDNKVKNWFNNKLIPSMGKLGNQTHLSAIRDTFGTLVPILVAGSVGLLIGFIIFGSGGTGSVSLLGLLAKASTGWSWDDINNFGANISANNGWAMTSKIGGAMFGVLSDITIGAMSIYFAFLFGYFIGTTRGANQPIMVGFISLGAFWIANMGQIVWSMGAGGLISAIIFGIIASELFCWLQSLDKLKVNLPQGVPPAIGTSFSMLIPIVFTLGAVAISNIIVLAPAIAATGWTVNAQKSLEVGTDLFSAKWDAVLNGDLNLVNLIAGSQWSGNSIMDEFIQQFGSKELNEAVGADFINWFEALNATDKSLVSTFMATEIFGYSGQLAFIDKFGTVNLVWMTGGTNGTPGLLAVFSFQQVEIGSDKFGWGQAIFKFFTSWFMDMAMSDAGLGLAIVCTFFSSFFWFFGVHGANVMAAIFDPIWFMVTSLNVALFSSLGMQGAIETGQMGYWGANWGKWFVDIGGSGGTLALIIGTWIFSARREFKELGKYAFPAGLFGINEPVIFGWPLVLNGVYAIPFMLIPLICIFPYWIFGPLLKWINPPVLMLPWTTPSLLGAVLANLDWRSIVPFMISFAIQIALWIPFILLENKLYFKKLKVTNPEAYEEQIKYRTDKNYRMEWKANNKKLRLEEKEKEKIRAEKRKQRALAAKQEKKQSLGE